MDLTYTLDTVLQITNFIIFVYFYYSYRTIYIT